MSHRKNPVIIALLLFIALGGAAASLNFTLGTGDSPWLRDNLQVDGPNYLKGLRQLTAESNFLNLKDLFHSPGYQIYLHLTRNSVGEKALIRTVKLFAWAALVLTLALIAYFGEHYLGPYRGWLAAAFLSWSFPIWAYMNCLQYEVLAAFFLTSFLVTFAVGTEPTKSSTAARISALLSASSITFLCLLNARFALLPVCAIAVAYFKKPARPYFLPAFVLGFCALSGSWILYQSLRVKHLVLFSERWDEHFYRGNNSLADGFYHLHKSYNAPHGLSYLWSHPQHFLEMLMNRFTFLWGLKPDSWGVESAWDHWAGRSWEAAHFIPFVEWSFLILVTAGYALALYRRKNVPLLYAIVPAAMVGPMLFYSSARYLIPLYPVLFLLVAEALVLTLISITGKPKPLASL